MAKVEKREEVRIVITLTRDEAEQIFKYLPRSVVPDLREALKEILSVEDDSQKKVDNSKQPFKISERIYDEFGIYFGTVVNVTKMDDGWFVQVMRRNTQLVVLTKQQIDYFTSIKAAQH